MRGVRTADGTVGADLVVDAGGRASRLPFWLLESGYGEVPVTSVRTDVVYTTRHFRYDPDRLPFAVINAPYPGMSRTGARAGRLVNVPWSMATATDLRFPQVEGPRRALDRPLNAYLHRYRAAAVHDPDLGAAFLRVSNMLAGPGHLLTPGRLLRVLLSPVRAGREPVRRRPPMADRRA